MTVDNIQFAAFCKSLKINDKNIRREIEDSLGDFNFSFFNFPPVSDTIIAPAMIGQTEHGHSRLHVQDKSVQLFVSFDEAFRTDKKKCFDYAFGKIQQIAKTLKDIDEQFHSGLVVQYLFDSSEYTSDVINLINRNSIEIKSGQQFFNFSKKFSVIYKDRYYLNFDISSIRIKESGDQFIGVIVDVNNRFAGEVKKELVGYDDIKAIKNIHNKISDWVLSNLLINGELDLDETR